MNEYHEKYQNASDDVYFHNICINVTVNSTVINNSFLFDILIFWIQNYLGRM